VLLDFGLLVPAVFRLLMLLTSEFFFFAMSSPESFCLNFDLAYGTFAPWGTFKNKLRPLPGTTVITSPSTFMVHGFVAIRVGGGRGIIGKMSRATTKIRRLKENTIGSMSYPKRS
jgi:hypothetical protein